MQNEKSDRMQNALENLSLQRRFWRLAVPNILSNVTVPLVGLADTVMLGHLPEVRFLAGVALASVVFDYIYWNFGFLRMATTGSTAQAHGRGDTEEVYFLLYRGLLLAVGIGAGILVLQRPLMNLSFALLQGSPDVEAAAKSYFMARIWGAPAVLCNYAFYGWYLGREESKYVLVMTVTGNIANVLLNYMFLFVFHLQAFGAGLGSMMSQYLTLAMALLIFRLRGRPVRWRRSRVMEPARLKGLLKLNFDILVRTLCLVSAFALFTNFSAVLGTAILAANSILLRFLDIAAYFIDGAAFATESLAGVFWGAKQYDRLRRLLFWALGIGEAMAFGFMAVIFVFSTPIQNAMTSHPEVNQLVARFDHWFYLTLTFGAIAYMYDGFFVGLTSGRVLRNAMIISFLVGFLPLAVAAVRSGNNHLLWSSMVLFMIFRDVTLFLPSRRLIRK